MEELLELTSEFLVFEYPDYSDDAQYANEVCIKKAYVVKVLLQTPQMFICFCIHN